LKVELEDGKLYLIDAPHEFGNHFTYKYPFSYRCPATRRNVTDLLDRVAFRPKSGRWEFPTQQWIYPIMTEAKKFGVEIENKEVLNNFINPGGLIKNPYHLWENQIKCLNKVTRLSHGIAILRTGAGKTTMISVMAKNMLDQGLKTIVMAPTNGVLHELRDRFSNDFDIDCNYYFDPEKQIQFVNPKGLFKSNKFWLHDPYWKDVDCIIMDEVENCMNEKFMRVLERINAPKYVFGFSGTANKITGGKMDFIQGGTHNDNELNLINTLGYTAWYEKPVDRKLNLVRIYPPLIVPPLESEKDKEDAFNKIPVSIAKLPQYHQMIEQLFKDHHLKNLYIPFVSRVAVTEFTNITTRPLGLITGSGFQYKLKPGDEITNCTLTELKEMMKQNKVEIVLGTRSSFAGIDFPPNWDSSLANCIGKMANSSVQAAGRVARAKEFNLFYCLGKGHVPIYNAHVKGAVKLMREYYKMGQLEDKKIKLEY